MAPAEEDKLESHGSASAAEEEKRQMAEQGGVVLAKARELMLLQHHRLGEVVKVGAIQNMIRKGDLRVTNAQVRDAMLAMKPTERNVTRVTLPPQTARTPALRSQASCPVSGPWTSLESTGDQGEETTTRLLWWPQEEKGCSRPLPRRRARLSTC